MGAVVSKEAPKLVMEYMDNGSLYDILHNESFPLEGDVILNILNDVSVTLLVHPYLQTTGGQRNAIPPHGDSSKLFTEI